MYLLTSAKFLMRVVVTRNKNLSVLVGEIILREVALHYLFIKCFPILNSKVYLKYFAILFSME